MIAVIFEVRPAPGRADDYLDIAAALRPELEATDGFVSVERFQSLTEPGKLLSLSFFRDEAAVRAWRGVFSDYRLRVAAVLRDYGKDERSQAPDDSRSVHG
jgi:quinol monooxygenase YgiN